MLSLLEFMLVKTAKYFVIVRANLMISTLKKEEMKAAQVTFFKKAVASSNN